MGTALVVLVVTMLTAVQPIATDMYVAALPAIRDEYAAPVTLVQLSIAVLVIAFGISQLFWGPASDRFGRKPVMLSGSALYAGGAAVGALAPTIELLLAARAAQGLGMAACMVCARAVVRDLYEPQRGTHVMTMAMSLLAMVAMLVPVTGALLAGWLGWRSTLVLMSMFGAGTLLLILLRVPETAPARQRDALRLAPLFSGYWLIARHRGFQSWTLLNSAGYAANFGFFSSSSYLFLETYGVSRVGFALALGGASVAYLAGTALCRRWLARHGIVRSVKRAGVMSVGASALFIVPQLFGAHGPLTLTAGLWMMLLAYGIHQPCGHVGIASSFPLRAGAASALGGSALAGAAFLCGAWLGLMFENEDAAVLSLTTGALVGSVALISLTVVQRHGAPPAATTDSLTEGLP